MKNIWEYIDSKGNLRKPKISTTGDEVDVPADRKSYPPKDWSGNKGSPYSTDGKKVTPKEKLGEMGDEKLKIDVCKKVEKAKIPIAESTNLKLIDSLVSEVKKNPLLISHIVNELKNAGLLASLVAEMTTHRNTFKHLAEIMANETYGPDICDRFTKALHEDVDAPIAHDAPDDVEGEEESEDELEDEIDLDPDSRTDIEMDGEEGELDEMPPTGEKPGIAPALEHFLASLKRFNS